MKVKCCQKKEINKKLHDLTEFLRVISDENRLRILCILKRGPSCVNDIWENLDLSQNLVSHHLKALKDFELVDSEKKGLKTFYYVKEKNINKYYKSLENFLKKI
jgi:ArsR family transcriptional regulator, arsenate/arsenite/antimonite-responsive transcriptional repressor